MRWYDSKYYTSVNTIEYVSYIFSNPQPSFYSFLVYELIETTMTIEEINKRLPFDKDFNRVSVNKLHILEKAKFKYHLKELRKYLNNPSTF